MEGQETRLGKTGQLTSAYAFPPNPNYGTGVFRRRIRLRRHDREVLAMLDDTNHAMWCRLFHDGMRVLAVEGATTRAPNTNCPGAAAALEELIGLPLDLPRRELYAEGRPRRNCTHLFDLAALAMAHARRPEAGRVYDVIIPDEVEEPILAEVRRDGETVLSWRISKGALLDPDTGAPVIALLKGFVPWASARFQGEALEAAMLLQGGYIVSGARRVLTNQMPDVAISNLRELYGVCYAYQPERLMAGVQKLDNVRDFSTGVQDAPEPEKKNARSGQPTGQ